MQKFISTLASWTLRAGALGIFLFTFSTADASITASANLQTNDLEIYGVVPSFFGDQPFKAVTTRLDSLKDLGINAIWLSPANRSDDPSAISYSITDYFHLRPDLGTDDDFRALISAAHARGIKVLMDFVPNHTSNQHPYFIEAQAKGKASSYYDYYERDAQGQPVHYFDWTNLMNLNYANPKVRGWITSAFLYWMDSFGVDGFRVDAAWGIKDRAPDFWSQLTSAVRKKHPQAILLAEASAHDPSYYKSGFDLAYDWTDELGKWAWEPAFNDMTNAGAALKAALTADPVPPQTIHFLNNNDTGDRFITRHGLALTKVASVLMQTLPGVPVSFSGDEVGAQYSPYNDPEHIDWSDPNHLRDFEKNLIALRHRYASLRSAQTAFIATPNTPAVLAYLREASDPTKDSSLLVVLNFGSTSTHVSLGAASFFNYKMFKDLVSNQPVPLVKDSEGWALEIPAQSAFVIEGSAR